jgi:hypothetical protein
MRDRHAFEERLNHRVTHLCLLQIVPIAMVFVNPITDPAADTDNRCLEWAV